MSTCILTGFAKKKRRIGTSYACDGGDLPATEDLGTSVYAGPFEAAQTVPATEVTYTIIGSTPCGGTVRRISTKTYSSRAVANQYKSIGTLTNLGVNEYDGTYDGDSTWSTLVSTRVGYGASTAEAYTDHNLAIWRINPQHGWSNGVDRGLKPVFVDTTSVTYSGASNVWDHTASQLTLYYLDLHEVLTYDLV